jgi:4-hydroxymandelate oxidase
MTTQDANRAGGAGVFVSHQTRQQLAGIAPTSAVLREIVEGVDRRAPLLVDGGVRSGTDVVRALTLGGAAVAIVRPVPCALAGGGQAKLDTGPKTLADEARVAMAGLGRARGGELVPGMVRATMV